MIMTSCLGIDEKYSSDGKPRGKRKKKSSKMTVCQFLKPTTLQSFKDLALVS